MKTAAVANRPLSSVERGLPCTYHVVTLGCRMNEHDSERMTRLLDTAGMVPVSSVPEKAARATHASDGGADVVALNTYSVRENAANKLYGHLGQLVEMKCERPGMMIAVSGCFAQQESSGILRHVPWADTIFGIHNIGMLPVLLRHAELRQEAAVELEGTLEVFPSMLSVHRTSPASAWVSINIGYNNTCTFCIMPSLRGCGRDRGPKEILRELQAVVAQGTVEITLLGQNVNSYGGDFGRRGAFAQLLHEMGRTPGLERLRFASPRPATFTGNVIAAVAETPTVMPPLHFPLQSRSDRVLHQMRRSYRVERFLRVLDEVRDAIPKAAITTDVIIGFPGEADADLEATLRVIEQARFSAAFTFIYSRRLSTPAADREDQVPSEVVSKRYQRLLTLQERVSTGENERLEDQTVEMLVGEQSTKDRGTRRTSGRARDNRLMHFALPPSLSRSDLQKGNGSAMTHSGAKLTYPGGEPPIPRPGDFVTVQVTHGAPYHLVADSALADDRFEVHRTRAGDLWEANQGTPTPGHGIRLGMPGILVVARHRRVAS